MIEYKRGDILKEKVDALVNTVNCVGVMGRGIALQFKNAFPDNYNAYVAACKKNIVKVGSMFIYTTGMLTLPRFIINFPTKKHWRNKSMIEDIESGLNDLTRIIQEKDIKSIAIPPIGCGLGGLAWGTVRPLIEHYLNNFTHTQIIVFEPNGSPKSAEMIHNTKTPTMTPGRAALITLMARYLHVLLDPTITLLELHKLMYFMQVAGEPLKLNYTKAYFGPYAENLRHVLNKIEGYYITGYNDGGDAPNKPLHLINDAEQKAMSVLLEHQTTRTHLDKVLYLIEGFESAFGLELLSSVHWVLRHENILSQEELIQKVYAWNVSKKKFSERQILLAAKVLQEKDWL